MNTDSIREFSNHYGELTRHGNAYLEELDFEILSDIYARPYQEIVTDTEDATVEIELGKSSFRAMVWDRNASDTIIIPRHFGGGVTDAVTQVVDTLDVLLGKPNVIVLPSDTPRREDGTGEVNMNFTKKEFDMISRGYANPMTRRAIAALDKYSLEDSTLHFLGASQGAHFALEMSQQLSPKDKTKRKYDVGSLSLVELPTEIDDRAGTSMIRLRSSSEGYGINMRMAGLGTPLQIEIDQTYPRIARPRPTPEYVAEATNINELIKLKARSFASREIVTPGMTVLAGKSKMTGDKVRKQSNRESLIMEGQYADHSIAMMPIVLGCIARRSVEMSREA